MVDLIFDPKARKEEIGSQLMKIAKYGGEEAFKTVYAFLENNDQFIRSSAVLALAHFDESNNPIVKDRRIYQALEPLLKDTEILVRGDTILALGESEDSRILFSLVNYFKDAPTTIKEKILMAMNILCDPRSKDFLINVRKEESDILVSMTEIALAKLENRSWFCYTYHGSEERRKEAEKNEHRIIVRSYENLEAISEILENDLRQSYFKPQTYVITLDHTFVLGGYVNEHVDVAQGKEVLAAGEVGFERKRNKWELTYLNNRSNGYFPGTNCYDQVRKVLERTDIKFPERFTEEFPKDGFFTEDFLCTQPFYNFWKNNSIKR